MLRLEYGNVLTKFRGDPISTAAVHNLLSCSISKQSGSTGNRVNEDFSIVTEDDCFPSGLYNTVKYTMLNQGFEVTENPVQILSDKLPIIPPDILEGLSLYPYQVTSVQEQVRRKRGNVEIGTGGGKSIIHGAFLKHLNLPSATVVYRKRHARQLYTTLKNKCNLDIELVTDPSAFSGECQHAVGHADAFYAGAFNYDSALGYFLSKVGVVSWDEAHHMRKMYQAVACAAQDAEYRIGYSATPYVTDDILDNAKDLEVLGYTGDTIIQVPASYLIEHGYLDPATIFMLPCEQPILDKRIQNYKKVQEGAYIENYHLHSLVLEVVQLIRNTVARPRILIIVDRIEHGHKLLRGLHNAGINTKFSSGQDKVWYIDGTGVGEYLDPDDDVADEFVSGEFDVLIGSVIFEEAIDLPEVTDVIVACGGRAKRRTKQRVGRAVRLTPQGTAFYGIVGVRVWDFFVAAHKYTRNQSEARLLDYLSEGHPVHRGYLDQILHSLGAG